MDGKGTTLHLGLSKPYSYYLLHLASGAFFAIYLFYSVISSVEDALFD